MGPGKHVLDEVDIPPTGRVILVVVRSTENHLECLLQCKQQKDNSIVNNGMQGKVSFNLQ